MKKPKSRKCLRTCCIATTTTFLLFLILIIILHFTIFKAKRPEIVATPVHLKEINLTAIPINLLHTSVGLDVFIKNRNYEGFRYGNTSMDIFYRENLVGQAPIPAGEIGARSTENIRTAIDLHLDKIVNNSNFFADFTLGMINFTSASTMVGDVILLKVIKLHATTLVNCRVTVFVKTRDTTSKCISTIKI